MGQGKATLRKQWESLHAPPLGLPRAELARWKRGRGYELEKLLIALARLEKLDAVQPYRGKGEQLDGFFTLDHWHFLLEAKWQTAPVSASEVYAFQGKLRGKLVGTVGLFVSVNGFAKEARAALVYGKQLDVLLADRDDIEPALDAKRTFSEMVRVKMRAAARTGDVYLTYQRWLDANPKLR